MLSKYRKLDNYDWVLIALLSLAIIVRLLVTNTNIISLLDNFLTDDAFYYYSIARNVAQGEGVVFSSGQPTNGFHPLYMLILVPLYEILYQYGINVPVYASLYILSIFTVGTGVFIYFTCKKLVGGFAGVISAIIWLFNPYVLKVSLAGTETPVQIFFISLLVWYLVSIDYKLIRAKQKVVIGVLLSLIFLSRMDGVLIMFGVLISLGIRWIGFYPSDIVNSVLKRDSRIYDLGIIASIPSSVILLWMGWSYVHVQRLTPVSGSALRLLRLELNDSVFYWVITSIKGTIISIQEFVLFVDLDGIEVILFLVIVFGLLGVLSFVTFTDKITEVFTNIDFVLISFVLFLFFYWFITMAMRSWYTLFIAFVLTICVSVLIGSTAKSISGTPASRPIRFLFVILIISSFAIGGITQYDVSPEEPHRYQDTSYIAQNIERGATIGSFNAGIRQYYTPNHTVVNLDGVVNNQAYEARSKGRLSSYISDSDICYLIIEPWAHQLDMEKLDAEIIHRTNHTVYYNICD